MDASHHNDHDEIEVEDVFDVDDLDFDTFAPIPTQKKNDKAVNQDTYENFLFSDIAMGLLGIYYNLIISLHTNKFTINDNCGEKTFTNNQQTSWQTDNIKSTWPRTVSQAIEEYEFIKVLSLLYRGYFEYFLLPVLSLSLMQYVRLYYIIHYDIL